MKYLKAFLASILICVFVYTIGNIYMAEVFAKKANSEFSSGNLYEGVYYADAAVRSNPYEASYYRTRAKALISLSSREDDEVSSRKIKEKALGDLRKAVSLNPDNLATIRNSIPLYFYLALKDLSKPGSSENVDKEFIDITRNYFLTVSERYPNDLGVLVSLAKYENTLGLNAELKETLEQIRVVRPDILEWHESLRDIDVSF